MSECPSIPKPIDLGAVFGLNSSSVDCASSSGLTDKLLELFIMIYRRRKPSLSSRASWGPVLQLRFDIQFNSLTLNSSVSGVGQDMPNRRSLQRFHGLAKNLNSHPAAIHKRKAMKHHHLAIAVTPKVSHPPRENDVRRAGNYSSLGEIDSSSCAMWPNPSGFNSTGHLHISESTRQMSDPPTIGAISAAEKYKETTL